MIDVAVVVESPLLVLIVLAMSGLAATLFALLAMRIFKNDRHGTDDNAGAAPAGDDILSAVSMPPGSGSADDAVLSLHSEERRLTAAAAVPAEPVSVAEIATPVIENEALRLAAEDAVRSGRKDLQAATRMQLAARARERGDSTTACEHWQMARMLFHEIGDKDGYKDVDEKMRANGCPTDWVLTDF